MPSTDPWYDWLITYGSLPPFPVPPDLAHLSSEGKEITEDENGEAVIPWPFPQTPPNAPECVQAWQQAVKDELADAYQDAVRYCLFGPFMFRLDPPVLSTGQGSQDFRFFIPGLPHDPCRTGSIFLPNDCPFLDDFFRGWNLNNCPYDYQLSPIIQPGLHRIVQEILRPTAQPFLFRVGYDNNLAALLFDWEVLREGDCASYAGGIGLQIEALMQECSNVISTDYRVILQAFPYYDGILWGIRFKIISWDNNTVSYANIGYNRLLEIGFCGRQRIFRDNVGNTACESEDDDMGCECEQIEQIIQTKLDAIKDEYLNDIKERTGFLYDLFQPIEQQIKAFWGSGQQSWTRFLQIFSYLWAYVRPSGTDDDEIILPSLTDRLEDEFERIKSRHRTLYSSIPRLMRISVKPSIIGERNTSRDTYIIGERNTPVKIPYNHYGQLWLEVSYTSGKAISTTWKWIRSRDQTIVYWLPDQRMGETDQVIVTPKWQLFPNLSMASITTEIALQAFADLTSPIWVPKQDQQPNPN